MSKPFIRLTYDQFCKVLSEVFDSPLDVYYRIKVEPAIKKTYADVQAIRVYASEFMQEINQCVERGEHPRLLIKRTARGKGEVEIVFVGKEKNRHVEEFSYYEKHPREWSTWGEIALTLDEARKLRDVLDEMLA